ARPVGFPGALDPVPLGAQPACEAPHLGRLARPLDPLERDEHSVHVQTLRVPQYATLARGPAPIVVARAPEATPRSWRRRRAGPAPRWPGPTPGPDRKSTRLNSSHDQISYAVFRLKKKKLKASVQAHSFGMSVVNNFNCIGFGS